jgi:hypothetical protein
MKQRVLVLVLAAVVCAAMAWAQVNPWEAPTISRWAVVQEIREIYSIVPIQGLSMEDLPRLDLFLNSRQLAGLWSALEQMGGRTESLASLLSIKYLGPSGLGLVLVFHQFSDEAALAPSVLGSIEVAR